VNKLNNLIVDCFKNPPKKNIAGHTKCHCRPHASCQHLRSVSAIEAHYQSSPVCCCTELLRGLIFIEGGKHYITPHRHYYHKTVPYFVAILRERPGVWVQKLIMLWLRSQCFVSEDEKVELSGRHTKKCLPSVLAWHFSSLTKHWRLIDPGGVEFIARHSN